MGGHKNQNLREEIKLKEENCTEKQRFPLQQNLKYTNKQIKMLLQQHYSTTTEVAIDSVKNRVLAIKIFSMLYVFC